MRDQRFGAVPKRPARRALRRVAGSAVRPDSQAAALLTLALGIGATTAIFSILDSVLLRPLPFATTATRDAVAARHARGDTHARVTCNFRDWRSRTKSMAHLAALSYWGVKWPNADGVTQVDAWAVSDDFFALMDRTPTLGRTFTPGEFARGRDKVFIVTHGFWQRQLGSDPTVVGRTFRVDDEASTLVGVMPPGFELLGNRDVFVPLVLSDEEWQRRQATYLLVAGRLAPGTTLEQARAEFAALGANLEREYPRENADMRSFCRRCGTSYWARPAAQYSPRRRRLCLLGVACATSPTSCCCAPLPAGASSRCEPR